MTARRKWSSGELAKLCKLYPLQPTKKVARALGRSVQSIYAAANLHGLKKTEAYLASPAACRLRRGDDVGSAHWFPPGHAPFNKGIKGWQAGGRSGETQFKKGNVSARWDPDTYFVGALRMNADGYVDIKIKEGSRAWRAFHIVLWEDANGPLPKGHCLRFNDGDRFNIDLDNLVLLSRTENMRYNTIHRYPIALKQAIRMVGKLERAIREKQDRRPT